MVKNLSEQPEINQNLIIYIIVAFHCLITIFLSLKLNVWIDEVFTLQTTSKNLTYALDRALNFELQPPLYFILLNLWRTANSSIFFARLFSIVCSFLALLIVINISKKILTKVNSTWIAIVFGFNPFLIWAATEIRLYAFVILLSSLLILLFYDGYISENPKTSSRRFYVIISVLGLYTQYYLGFFLVANGVTLVILRRWNFLAKYLSGILLTTLVFLPMMVIFLHQYTTVSATSVEQAYSDTIYGVIRSVYSNIANYLLPYDGSKLLPYDSSKWILLLRRWILRFFIIAIIYFVAKNYKDFFVPKYIAIWTIFVVLSILFLIVRMILGETFFRIRHTAILFVPIIIHSYFFSNK